jgi:hypothetical protein
MSLALTPFENEFQLLFTSLCNLNAEINRIRALPVRTNQIGLCEDADLMKQAVRITAIQTSTDIFSNAFRNMDNMTRYQAHRIFYPNMPDLEDAQACCLRAARFEVLSALQILEQLD